MSQSKRGTAARQRPGAQATAARGRRSAANKPPSPPSAIRRPRQPRTSGGRRPATVPALAEQARTRLEEMIVKLDLPPGSVWSEQQLSEMIGIGRTPVREALQRLQSQFMVRVLPRLGAQVTDINVTEQMQLLEVRRVLERLIAGNAARRSSTEERAQMLKMAERLETLAQTGDAVQALRFDADLKRYVAHCARNPYAARAIEPAHAMSRRFYYLHHRERQDLPLATRLHAESVRAIVAGNEDDARACVDRLLDYVEEMTRSTIGTKK